jgi:short-subunit dehydrogenase
MKKYEGYALITGGSSGIGLAFAHLLAAEGYDLVLVAQDNVKLKKTATMLKKTYKVKVLTLSQDLADRKATDKVYNFVQKKKIYVGLLVNNAGFSAGLDEFQVQDCKKTLNMIQLMCVNLTELTYKFLPHMLKEGSGGIILTSSIAASLICPLFAVYSATKAFSLKFGINLHAELDGKGVDVLTVCPGIVDTNFFIRSGIGKFPFYVKLNTPINVAQKALGALGRKPVILVASAPERFLNLLVKLLPLKIGERFAYFMTRILFKETINHPLKRKKSVRRFAH